MIKKFIPGEILLVKQSLTFWTPKPCDVSVGDVLSVISADGLFVNFMHPVHGLLAGYIQTESDYRFWNEKLIRLVDFCE